MQAPGPELQESAQLPSGSWASEQEFCEVERASAFVPAAAAPAVSDLAKLFVPLRRANPMEFDDVLAGLQVEEALDVAAEVIAAVAALEQLPRAQVLGGRAPVAAAADLRTGQRPGQAWKPMPTGSGPQKGVPARSYACDSSASSSAVHASAVGVAAAAPGAGRPATGGGF